MHKGIKRSGNYFYFFSVVRSDRLTIRLAIFFAFLGLYDNRGYISLQEYFSVGRHQSMVSYYFSCLFCSLLNEAIYHVL